ncbi:class I SAM-dependent methyltransferase [Cellulomonas triticagri]|nr:class I SAM-dependent methyltransferase [Cellulomonas triticagri]
MDPLDASLITRWGTGVVGPILDAGCGPGHWTDHLREQGCEVRGIDLVPEFIARARERFPHASFDEGDLLASSFRDSSFGGVLAWYSLIHMQPGTRRSALEEIARILRPSGALLVGAFLGVQDAALDHAVSPALLCSEQGLASQLESAGFQVDAIHTRSPDGRRPHLAVLAHLL